MIILESYCVDAVRWYQVVTEPTVQDMRQLIKRATVMNDLELKCLFLFGSVLHYRIRQIPEHRYAEVIYV